jgi:hypothetical protein
MSIAIQKTLTITIDETIYDVIDTSEDVQQMVVYLDEWRQNEADEAANLLKTRAALRELQNMILAQIQKESEEVSEEASEETIDSELTDDSDSAE